MAPVDATASEWDSILATLAQEARQASHLQRLRALGWLRV